MDNASSPFSITPLYRDNSAKSDEPWQSGVAVSASRRETAHLSQLSGTAGFAERVLANQQKPTADLKPIYDFMHALAWPRSWARHLQRVVTGVTLSRSIETLS